VTARSRSCSARRRHSRSSARSASARRRRSAPSARAPSASYEAVVLARAPRLAVSAASAFLSKAARSAFSRRRAARRCPSASASYSASAARAVRATIWLWRLPAPRRWQLSVSDTGFNVGIACRRSPCRGNKSSRDGRGSGCYRTTVECAERTPKRAEDALQGTCSSPSLCDPHSKMIQCSLSRCCVLPWRTATADLGYRERIGLLTAWWA